VNTTVTTTVTIDRPAGVADGDVLIGQITADNNPDVTSAPAGWSTVLAPRSASTMARLFVYYHVVTDASTEPATYTWQLSSAQKWNAGLADFQGVDPTTPFDTAASGATAFGTSTIAVPGVTTVTPGALVVGGIGVDSGSATVTQPTGWTEALESTGAQVTETAYQARPTAGATGTATWTLSKALTSTGWLRALRPKG
jgi:hypothetical protein